MHSQTSVAEQGMHWFGQGKWLDARNAEVKANVGEGRKKRKTLSVMRE